MSVDVPAPPRRRARARTADAVGAAPPPAPAGPGDSPGASRRAGGAVLRVVGGLQAGATVPLASGARLSLGGGDDDIVLRDPAVGTARGLLECRGGAVSLRVVESPVALDGTAVEPGRRVAVPPGARLVLGDVALAIDASAGERGGERVASASAGAFVDDAADVASDDAVAGLGAGSAAGSAGGVAGGAAALGARAPVPRSMRAAVASDGRAPASGGRRAARVGSMVVCLLGLGGLVAAATGVLDAPPPAAVPIETALAAAPFSALSLTRESGVLGVDGVLPDAAALRELDALLGASGLTHVNRVETEGSLAVKVLDVLRVNGVEAALAGTRGAHVTVTTSAPAARDLDELARTVERDVPALASLTIDNTPPPEPAPSAPPTTDPGKRVALVVSAPPAHVVTEDRSRYFVGAVLPSGHRIAAIADNRVTLEKDGERTELAF